MGRAVSESVDSQDRLGALEREAAALRVELATVQEQLQAARRLADRYRGEVESLRTSTTWRVATALKSGVRNPRRLPGVARDVTAMLRGRG